mmetsp:Transcript_25501/g.38678  ORF Transcript_25501/g.38678 Transcript_25501/m.38678 type:complete len:144 (-) Transcript_25501:279-710(-)|eukprot:CAMPEP_0178903664 /NCGR_PEP_ID=MMETSP0786-20121207/5277_1 /TAXON_ID=186022 /ORGANISM="Thalassionema frauenfeldii, Strain CCMP 1798" /LENGTH=143 /DNA_ID=CAMNT_0020575049 /DNA_START=28 /DNA_END=459 /DNA_ORIENTATION=+
MTDSSTTRQKSVSFQSILYIYEYTAVADPETKSKLYYTDHELKMMKIKAKSMRLEQHIQEQQLQLAILIKQNSELLSFQLKTSFAAKSTGLPKRPVTPDEEIESILYSRTPSLTGIVKRPITPDDELEAFPSNKRMRFLPVAE